jgi:glycosyltransferase involved in cell wall biosynthesis
VPPWDQAAFAIRKHWLGTYRFPLPVRAARRALRQIRPDLVLAHFGGAGAAMAPLAHELGIPLVVVFHAFDLFTRQFRADTYATMWESVSHAVAVSEHGRTRLVELGCPEDKARVVHCGVDTVRFAPANASRQAAEGFRLVSIGRLVEKKGFDDLLRAVAAISSRLAAPVHVDIWGDGPMRLRLGSLACRLGLRHMVTFKGVAANRTIPRLLHRYDVFVLASRTARNGDTEGIPITILEAQAAGLPVVATQHAGIPEAVPPGNREWLARENDVDDMAGKLLSLAANSNRWRAIGMRGRDWVLRHFALGDEVKAYRSLFNNVLERPSANPVPADGPGRRVGGGA